MTATTFSAKDCHAGFFGKLPARGDFVRAGLPSSFVTPWDEWMSRVLEASQRRLGSTWLDAWRQAPIWHFALAPSVCGPDSVLGLWMPSMDRVGRNYPLVLAAVLRDAPVSRLTEHGAGFLDEVENAGLDALEDDLEPEQLADRVASAVRAEERMVVVGTEVRGASLWWTQGSPIVPATARAFPDLPGPEEFSCMIDARITEAPGT